LLFFFERYSRSRRIALPQVKAKRYVVQNGGTFGCIAHEYCREAEKAAGDMLAMGAA
jgi:hypothetical protein